MRDYKNVNLILNFILDNFNNPENVRSIVDMTLGNGHDSLKLLKHFDKAFLYGFDIQEEAIASTDSLLKSNGYMGRYELFKESHERASDFVKSKADIIVYNLGYLPGGNKEIKTRSKTTLLSIKDCLENLSKSGSFIFITYYLGHEGGEDEYFDSLAFLKDLNQKEFNVSEISFINQVNKPPKLIIIERK